MDGDPRGNRIDVRRDTDDCGVHPGGRSPVAGRVPDRRPERGVPDSSIRRDPVAAVARTDSPAPGPGHPRIPDKVYELGWRICTDGWDEAVAWRLAGALDGAAWSAVRKRPPGLCLLLAAAAAAVEDAASALGEAAGLATLEVLRLLRQPRLVQKIGQTLVARAVPKIGESQTAAVAHCLRIVGVWICLPDPRFPWCCACFEAIAKDHTEQWVQDELERHLTDLRAVLPRAR